MQRLFSSFWRIKMSTHYKPPPTIMSMYGQPYQCDHPLYDVCTLYLIQQKGLAVIQQRFDRRTKHTYWHQIDDCLVDDIYNQQGFYEYFQKHANYPVRGIYPTVTVRQIMHALRMRPLIKEPWETVFDHQLD